jgi:RNA polymerase sigma-70 factor, ECF subfamily
VTDEDFSLTRDQVRAAQSGDEAALDNLFQRYLPRVTRLVAARLGEQWGELANEDDLIQESFVDALKALRGGKLTTDGDFCNWMAKCVQNNIRDQFRRAHAGKRDRNRERRREVMGESFLTESILDADSPSPSQVALGHETEGRLEEALRGLSPVYREVISLRAYCGMSHREIAKTMGLPSENTANALFLRARAELRSRLG